LAQDENTFSYIVIPPFKKSRYTQWLKYYRIVGAGKINYGKNYEA